MKKLLLTPVLLLTMSGYALAADAVVIESPPEVSVVPAFNFGDFDVNFEGSEFTTDLTTNDVRLGLAWKF